MPQEKAVAILSGGLDSALSLLLAKKKYDVALSLTFDYGQRASQKEIGAAASQCRKESIPHRVLPLPWLKEITPTALVDRNQPLPSLKADELEDGLKTTASARGVWVPNRNGLFLNIAASFAEGLGAAAILTGFNREEAETFPDNSASFVEAANGSLRFSTLSGVRVESPTLQMNKLEIVQEGLRVQLPFELTWSCYEGFDKMCGACESCLRSKRAYHEGGVWERMKRLFNT